MKKVGMYVYFILALFSSAADGNSHAQSLTYKYRVLILTLSNIGHRVMKFDERVSKRFNLHMHYKE